MAILSILIQVANYLTCNCSRVFYFLQATLSDRAKIQTKHSQMHFLTLQFLKEHKRSKKMIPSTPIINCKYTRYYLISANSLPIFFLSDSPSVVSSPRENAGAKLVRCLKVTYDPTHGPPTLSRTQKILFLEKL